MGGPLNHESRGDEISSGGLSSSSASEGEVEENFVGGKEEEGDGEEGDSEGEIEDSLEGARRRLAPHVVMNA